MPNDDGLTAVKEHTDGRWRWVWRSPWGVLHHSPRAYTSKAQALAAGRKWLGAL